MDYEREPDSGFDASSSESQPSKRPDKKPAANRLSGADEGFGEREQQGTADAQRPDSDGEGLGTDADVMDDSFRGGITAPEWPSVDFESESEALAAEASALADGTATDEAADAGDDSDAPVITDALTSGAVPQTQAHIRADKVSLTQGGAQSIDANTVTLSQGGAGQVRAEQMTVEQSGVGLARVNTLHLGAGASAFAVVADEATVEEGSNAFLVVSRSFNGEVQPTIDWRTALAFGAGIGLVLSIFRRIR